MHGSGPASNSKLRNGCFAWAECHHFMYVDTPAGAHASAVIYSLVETCKANGLEPYTWLRRVLRLLPAANNVDEIVALLPWNLRNHDLASELPV